MEQKDLAGKTHWDSVYRVTDEKFELGWRPGSYDQLSLENMLLREIDRCRPETILEVGCGSSPWLPYLSKKRGLKVYGMDYSEKGCELARKRLKAENVTGTIFCQDLFKADLSKVGSFDFVYSLGVVEHFSDLENTLSHLLKLVKPGGVLLTEVPNTVSINGFFAWLYQPKQLAKHSPLTKTKLEKAYNRLSLREVHSAYVGFFSLNIVAWGFNQRHPKLDKIILPVVYRLAFLTDTIQARLNIFKGISLLAPFIYLIGRK